MRWEEGDVRTFEWRVGVAVGAEGEGLALGPLGVACVGCEWVGGWVGSGVDGEMGGRTEGEEEQLKVVQRTLQFLVQLDGPVLCGLRVDG